MNEARRVAHSMTGFAEAAATLPDGRSISVRIKSVNARHLEVQVRVPAGLDALEAELRTLLKGVVRRGHLEVSVYVERGTRAAFVHVDEGLLRGYMEAHRRAAELVGRSTDVDLNMLIRLPGVMTAGAPAGFDEDAVVALRALTTTALDSFNRSRAAEGEALVLAMREGAARMAELTEEAGQLRREIATGAVERLRARLAELAGESVDVGPERLLAEATLLVARGDVEEELVRLRTHLDRFRTLLDGGGEVGKPLEFLLQELNREANTLLSKTGGVAGLRLTELGLAMKVELERAREQVMNLE